MPGMSDAVAPPNRTSRKKTTPVTGRCSHTVCLAKGRLRHVPAQPHECANQQYPETEQGERRGFRNGSSGGSDIEREALVGAGAPGPHVAAGPYAEAREACVFPDCRARQ